MSYAVKEAYYTLQGEGINAGRAAVFCRFAGCNLWNGTEKARASSICTFCDTDFVGTNGPGGGSFKTASELADHVRGVWRGNGNSRPLVVCTGGEPLLQLDLKLIDAFHSVGFEIAVETNGTLAAPAGIDWICVSPKADAVVIQDSGNELKLVFPQAKAMPDRFEHLNFDHFLLQPMDGPNRDHNAKLATQYCLEHPHWRLSLQTHKYLGIP